MAKFETELRGDFDSWVRWLDEEVATMSVSATLDESIEKHFDGTRIAVRAYERYSMAGSSRLGLTVILVEANNSLWLSAVSTGGSQAVFFKFNTWGEESFLSKFIELLDEKDSSF